MTVGLYDVFDHPYPIRLVQPSEAAYDANDEWQGDTPTVTAITGHISVFTRADHESEWSRRNPGIIEEGNPRLATYTYCPKGAIIEVERTATLGQQVDRYRVVGVIKQQTLVAKLTGDNPRWEFALAEVPAGGPPPS